jgi:hypothetical protein
MVSLILWPLNLVGQARHPLNSRLGGHKCLSERVGEQKVLLYMTGISLKIYRFPARTLVTVPTQLSHLLTPSNVHNVVT